MGWERAGAGQSGRIVGALPFRNGSSGCLWLETLPDYPPGGHAAFGEWGSMPSKKIRTFFVFFWYVD